MFERIKRGIIRRRAINDEYRFQEARARNRRRQKLMKSGRLSKSQFKKASRNHLKYKSKYGNL